jgi:hypothetical protein
MSIPEFPSDDRYVVIMRFGNGYLDEGSKTDQAVHRVPDHPAYRP